MKEIPPCLSRREHKARHSVEPCRGTDGGGTPLVEGGRAARRHDRLVVHPILPHRRHPDDARVARVHAPAGHVRRVPGRPPQRVRDVRPVHEPQRIGHRTGLHPSRPRPARMDRFPAAARGRAQRGRPRPPAVRRRPDQGARRLYERHFVLVDRSHGEGTKVWPVRYRTMFHMANASGLFRTAAESANAGFYPVRGNHWRKGNESYLPLYQGRMIGQFDHRPNAVRVNPHNTHNPYLSGPVGEAQHRDPDFSPQSRYWVPAEAVRRAMPEKREWTIAYRRSNRSTDVRTMIAALVPAVGLGDSVFLSMREDRLTAGGRAAPARQSQQLRFRLRDPPKGGRDEPQLVRRRTTARHHARTIRTNVRRHDRGRHRNRCHGLTVLRLQRASKLPSPPLPNPLPRGERG